MITQEEKKTEYPSRYRFIMIGPKDHRICGFVEDDGTITEEDFPNCEKCGEIKIWVQKRKKTKVLCNSCDNLNFEPTKKLKIPEFLE